MDMINIGGDASDPHYRYKLPQPEFVFENKKGGTTIVKNIYPIAERLGREVRLLDKYFSKQLGSSVKSKKGKGMVIVGKFDKKRFSDMLQKYIDTEVLCKECGNPETERIEKKKSVVLKCRACGNAFKLT